MSAPRAGQKAGQRAGLGRGLASLLGEDFEAPAPDAGTLRRLPLSALRPSLLNPRKAFDAEALDELARSIAARGLVQPIVVREAGEGTHEIAAGERAYEIVAGERRFRAASLAGLAEVPVLVVEADDGAALEIAIVENVQRADLNIVEEARGYAELVARFGYAQADLAQTLSKSRSHVANTMRLLKLPGAVLDHLAAGRLTAGQARPLVGRDDAEALATRIVAEGLSARQVERLVQEPAATATRERSPSEAERIDALRDRFARCLGQGIALRPRGAKGGATLALPDAETLEALLAMLEGR